MSKKAIKNILLFFGCFLFSFLVGVFSGFSIKKEQVKFVEVEKIVYQTVCLEEQENKEEIEMIATAYCSCEKCCNQWALNRPKDENGNEIVYTASGTVAKQGRTIAADPKFYPYGTKVIFDGVEYTVEDCGGAIKGNRIDVYFDNHKDALIFGKKTITATIERVS